MVPLNKRILMMGTALTVGLGLGWVVAAQEAPAKVWKGKDGGREEYDLEQKAANAPDGKQRVAALDVWKNRFPDTDYMDLREDLYVIAYQEVNDCRKSFDQSIEVRKRRPGNFMAVTRILSCVYNLPAGGTPSAADLTTAEQVAKYAMGTPAIFTAPENKPLTMTPEQVAAAKPAVEKLAQQTYAWVFVKRQDWAKAVPEIRKFLAMDPSQLAFTLYLAEGLMNQARANAGSVDNAKYIEALYHYARAGSYSGQGALPDAAKQNALKFFNNAYDTFHGSADGKDQVIQIASRNVMPPSGFTIKDVNKINQEKFAEAQAWDAAHPDLAYWRDYVKGPLSGADAASLFENNFKDAQLPGMPGAEKGVLKFKGTIISSVDDGKGKTKSVTVGVWDPAIPDATLNFFEAMPGMMDPGAEVHFEGVVKAYIPSPFMVTFEVGAKEIEGWIPKVADEKAK